jgi:hypothetical protein
MHLETRIGQAVLFDYFHTSQVSGIRDQGSEIRRAKAPPDIVQAGLGV